MGVFENTQGIVLENKYAEITLSKKNATVLSVIDKLTGKSIQGDSTAFFSLATREETIPVTGLTLANGCITVSTEVGCFEVGVTALDRYFTLEILSDLPEGAFRATVAHVKYDYDVTDPCAVGASVLPMSIYMRPSDYPDGKKRETWGEALRHTGSRRAKLALIVCPMKEMHSVLKEVTLAIDKNVGIRSSTGGAFGRDSRRNFSNYSIQYESSREFIDANIPFFKQIGVGQIDFHQGGATFRQGDFKFMRYENGAEFKKNVSDVLAEHGMEAGLHTYSFYVSYGCDPILSVPEYQAQLKVMASFTLAEDITAESEIIPTLESTADVSMDRGFCKTNSPFLLIDNELIEFAKDEKGFRAVRRGCAGTVPASHTRRSVVKHLEGHYHGLVPVFGSELFYEIARRTAKAYNEGGFRMIYLDALDGIHYHCERGVEDWFYMAAFVAEVLKYCETDPVLEAATFGPSMYAARGRIGAWDTPYRGYKLWNKKHAEDNIKYIDRHSAPILGWYNYYPMTDIYPGNEHTKYHHTDAIEHMGALAVMYDYSNVFNGIGKAGYERFAGMRRNIALYKKYDELRRAQVFSEKYRQRLIDSPYEVALTEADGAPVFVEKKYEVAKLYDLNDPMRNTASFDNPFAEQVPFIRIEAFLSAAKASEPMVLLALDENKPLLSQPLSRHFEKETDLSDRLAKVVRVKSNGKGGKIAIKTRCATNSEHGYGEYIIDLDYEGWREFILIESDNGERTDHGFEKNEGLYAIHRSSLNHDRTTDIAIETEGDVTDVYMSSVLAYEHSYEILKNPTVTVGDASIMFECELASSDFIEFDGKSARVVDRYGNEKPIWFSSALTVPAGEFSAVLTARALNRGTPRAQLTFGFTGNIIQ